MWLHYGDVCGGVREETMPLAWCSAGFQSLPALPTSKLDPSGADSWVGGFVYVLGPCESLLLTLLWGWSFSHCHNPHRFLQSEVLRLYFPTLESWVAQSVSFPQFLLAYLHANVGALGLPATTLPNQVLQPLPCHKSSPPQLPISAPPTSLDGCFFFNFLIVGLTYSLIFCLFCFLFLNLLSFFWLCEEVQCIYLCLHLSWKFL